MLTKRDLIEMIDNLNVEIMAVRRDQMEDHEKIMVVVDLLKDLVGKEQPKKRGRKKKEVKK